MTTCLWRSTRPLPRWSGRSTVTAPSSKRLREDAFAPAEPEFIEEAEAIEEETPQIVRRKHYPVRPMSLEDAIMQMELLGHSFFVFVDIDTECTNVIYQRKDGSLGLLEPEA